MSEPWTKKTVLEAAARGEGCLGRCDDDEPVFVIVARDYLGADTVRDWCERAIAAHVAGGKVGGAVDIANAMDLWTTGHGAKVPD